MLECDECEGTGLSMKCPHCLHRFRWMEDYYDGSETGCPSCGRTFDLADCDVCDHGYIMEQVDVDEMIAEEKYERMKDEDLL